jgi:TonB family protein
MPPPRPLRLAPEWDDRFARMVAVSALGHVLVVAGVILLAGQAGMRPLPPVAYTVELTDPNALGGRVPPGPPGADLSGGPAVPPAPEPKASSPAPAKPPEPPPEAKPAPKPEPVPETKPTVPEPVVTIPKAVEPPKVEPKPEPPKPEPKPEAKKPEPPKPEPRPEAKKPEPPKPEPPKTEPKPPEPQQKAPAKPAASPKPAEPPHAAQPGTGHEEAAPHDAYAAAAERWHARSGGGLGGTQEGSGPIGSGGEGKGGGGQVVGLDFIAYRQQVINTIKAQWTNLIVRPGLVATVRFQIAPDGQVSDVALAKSSGNPAYDASVMRAVQHTNRLPPPPARYVTEFSEFQIDFHSEESGGQGAG